MGKFSSRLPRYRSQNRDLGNRASPASHMNTSILLQRKEWRGEIAETDPARLTGLIWRGPHWVPSHDGPIETTCAICAQRIWRVILTNQKQNEVPIQSLSAWSLKRSQDKMADDLPYKAEYAKSGRSSCKLCRSNIDKDSLRVAKMVQVRNLFQNSCLIWRLRSILSADDYQPWCSVIRLKWLHLQVSLTCYSRYFSVSSLWRQGKEDKFAAAFLYDSVSYIANLPLSWRIS